MSELVILGGLSRDEARSLTDEVKQDAERLWRKLVELYEGGAHIALGYSSWGDYFKAEFGGEKSQAYRILDAGRVAVALDSPIGERGPNEAQARELAPLLRDEGEEAVLKVWREAKEQFGVERVSALNLKQLIGNRARRVAREQEIRTAAAHDGPLDGENYWLLHGDLLEVEIPVAVNVIITDPPYPVEFLDCYAKLSKLGAHVLPAGGSVVAMAGQLNLVGVHERMRLHLDYVWELAWLYANGAKQRQWQRHVFNAWKPLLWYAKGEPQVQGNHGGWIRDLVANVGDPVEDKAHHKWGQSVSGVRELVEMFSRPGDTILDPFVGGGSTAVAALEAGRRFVGIDVDEQAIRTTAARIDEMMGRAA